MLRGVVCIYYIVNVVMVMRQIMHSLNSYYQMSVKNWLLVNYFLVLDFERDREYTRSGSLSFSPGPPGSLYL